MNLLDADIIQSEVRRKISRSGETMFVLIIKRGVLEEGSSYKIRLIAQRGDAVGFAETIVTMNSPPKSGLLTSSFTVGMF